MLIPCYNEGQTIERVVKDYRKALPEAGDDLPALVERMVSYQVLRKDYLAEKEYVSRQHARFTVEAGKVFVENLSRTNRTYVNNEEIPDAVPVALADGDEIGLGGKVIGGSRQDKAAYLIFRVKK